VTQNSGYEFAGTVKAVEHATAAGHGVSATRITFQVDAAVRGVHTGQTLVIAEWAGLWGSREQYRVGERVFLFLYPLSKLGLTSPVQGTGGRFRIAGNGRVVVRPEQKGALPERVARTIGDRREIELSELAGALRMAEKE
jgi:predicted Rdx family selenoprotein